MNLPNTITLIRIFLVPFFFTFLVSYRPGEEHWRWAALITFFIAAATDALDGFLARVFHSRTELGRFLDPLADKLLLLSGFLGLSLVSEFPHHPPLWVTVTIVFRDLIIVGGLIIIFLMSGRVRIEPNMLGKSTTALQMATLLLILFGSRFSILFCWITAGLSILSCLVYMIREMKKLTETS